MRDVILEYPAEAPAEWAESQIACEPVETEGKVTGVKVTSVTEGSAAAAAGVAVGSVILAINNLPVKSNADVIYAFGKSVGKACHVFMPLA